MKTIEFHIIKVIFTMLVLTLPISALQSCNTNNGDIGPLYGVWVMDEMTIDGVDADLDLTLYCWRFQNNIVQITVSKPLNDFVNTTGTWSLDDNELTLYFYHHNNDDKLGGYTPPQELCLDRGITIVHIDALTDSKLVMNFIDKEGQTVKYMLRKLK